MIGQELCTEGRSYCQNEPSLSIDAISDKRTYQERYVILVIVFITIIMKIIQSICHHDGLKQLYIVHFSIYCFSKHCHKQDNKVVILVSSILRVVIPIWLQNVLNVDDNLDRKLENKIFNYILIFFSALTIHLFV